MSPRIKLSTVVFVIAGCLTTSISAFAEDTPARVRGTLQKMDGNNLTIATKSGMETNVPLKDGAPVIAVTKGAMSDIKDNTFVGITAMPQPDGSQKAVEVHVFEESLRGVGEGHYPWDLKPDSTMTNATVAGVASAGADHTLKVSYKGNESEYVVDADCPVFGYTQGDASLLKPGAAVFVIALKKPDGSLTAQRLTAEKDGIKPPM